MIERPNRFPWLQLILMSSITFMGILSELVPSGICRKWRWFTGFSFSYWFIVSIYAMLPLGTIPVILTMPMNRKTLTLILLAIFSVSNLVIAISTSYYFTAFARLIGFSRSFMADDFCLCHALSFTRTTWTVSLL